MTDHKRLSLAGWSRLKQCISWAAKATLYIACWVGIWALLALYGPPAMSVVSGPPHATGFVPAALGIVLAGGVATMLTVGVGVFVLAALGWHRNRTPGEQDGTDVPDALGDGE